MTLTIATDIAAIQKTPETQTEIFYPSEDGEPLAETSVHSDAIITTVAVLRNYLAEKFAERSPVVLADQFLYYAQGFSRLRVAPDVMVIFDIPQQPYDNYKIWETGQVPSVIFEMTSASTQAHDQAKKKSFMKTLGFWNIGYSIQKVNGFLKNCVAIVVKPICPKMIQSLWFMKRSLMV
jgi:Uma2 family endonuclease